MIHRILRRSGQAALLPLLMASFMLLPFSSLHAATLPQEPSDREVSDAVEDEFLVDPAIDYNRIDVMATDGVVTLTGRVENILVKRRASRLARSVRGVRSVVNDVNVAAPARRDEVIENEVVNALAADPATESYEVDVRVEDGRLTLAGTVDSWQEKDLAEKVSMNVEGITRVENDIVVSMDIDRPEDEIRADVEATLRWDVLVDDVLIDVEVDGTEVHLSGTVGSASERQLAIGDAYVTGVEEVTAEDLDVAAWARAEEQRGTRYQVRDDEAVAGAISDALKMDPRVDASRVEVRSRGGIVTLRGKVGSLKSRRAAARDAQNTVGVIRVENRLKVRPGERVSDEALAENVRVALQRDPYVGALEIDVDVDDGEVRLSGQVDTYFEKARADDAASRVHGVWRVENDLRVDDETQPLVYDPYVDTYPYDFDWYDYRPGLPDMTDEEIREEIREEMIWSPFVDADQVTVAVEDGKATLIGRVDSWSERQAATENAYEGGAVWVDNELEVLRPEAR